MSDAKSNNDNKSGDKSSHPTRSFDGSVVGPGGQIGPFRIERELGRGGAGVVYLAHDTKLDRAVAVKSLPDEVMSNPKARTRFAREARVLASLNHPNIATIYDELQEAEGVGYLILEYIPGQTLAERIAASRLKLQEVLSIAQQIAEAVAAAHEHDVIHRDLKPGNIKVTPEGKAKVLDFGLAKVVGGETTDQQSTVTEPGRIVGTPAYMSPEQARGTLTDKRSDIWSFGCVLYEMLTGTIPFRGETISDTLAGILEREPNWQALPESTPTNIRVLLRRCLEKDPRRRLRDIGDAGIEISETLRLLTIAPSATTPLPVLSGEEAVGKPKMPTTAVIAGAAVIVILSVIAVWFISKIQTQASSREVRLVVLPFENVGSAEDEYFADSITDEITSHLAPTRGLFVISPRTAAQYKKGEKNAQQIGKELGVDYILEGVVQRERPSEPTSRMRVMPRLIRASEDRLVLAPIYPIYNEDMNELSQVQSDLAERVVQALDVTLLEPQRRALQSRPTENKEAHEYYLRGNDYFHRSYDEDDFRIAIQMYDKAVKLDSTFALAYARLSMAHSWMYWFYDRTHGRLTSAKQAVDKAFQLNRDLPEAHAALGRHYYNHLDFERALEHFAIAQKSLPNNSEILSLIGYAQRRQGKFEQALANIKRACELDPLSNNINLQLAVTFMLLHKYPEAERYYERAIWLRPDVTFPYFWKARLYLLWQGSTEKAWVVFERAAQNIGSLDDSWLAFKAVVLNVLDGDYQEALDRLSTYEPGAFDSQFHFVPKAQLSGQINDLMGNQKLAQAHYESARSILEAKIQEQPKDARFHSSLGIAYAGLGRKQLAIREGKLGLELLPVTEDAWRGLYHVEALARIYVMVDEFDAAIEQLDRLLSIPGEMSIPLIRLDPTWAPLRDHPRFKKLLEEKE